MGASGCYSITAITVKGHRKRVLTVSSLDTLELAVRSRQTVAVTEEEV